MTTTRSDWFDAGEPPSAGTTAALARSDALVSLDDAGATDPALVGSKAATLARAKAAGLPVLPGVVVTTRADIRAITNDADRSLPRSVSTSATVR